MTLSKFRLFNYMVGIFSINCGIVGTSIEHDKIKKYSSSQYGINSFDKFMISVDYHIKSFMAYTLTFPFFLYGLPFHRDRYINLVYKFPLHFILNDRYVHSNDKKKK